MLEATLVPCSSGCGFTAWGTHPTCCNRCKCPDGPHARDCPGKNRRVRPECSRGCGRTAFGSFKTCCTHCKGAGGPHASDCAEKCVQQAFAAPPPVCPVAPVGGPGGGVPLASVVGTLQCGCSKCGRTFSVQAPPGAPPGTSIHFTCPRCDTAGEVRTPGRHRLDGGPEVRPSGRRRALLIGCNYPGTRAELRGCVNDVHNIVSLLTETFGWDRRCMNLLTDDDPRAMPTAKNIIAGFHWLVGGATPGDVLFLHYSGHGAQQPDPHGIERDGMNETILPVDFQSEGMITDDQISDIVVKPLPEGVKLTAIFDCCHSGTGLDLPFMFTERGCWEEEVNPFHSPSDVQLFSGCRDSGTSADASSRYGEAGGAMTTAFCEVLRQRKSPPYSEFINDLNVTMKKRGFSQRPQLSSNQKFTPDRAFSFDSIVANSNDKLGRTVRQRFAPQPAEMDPTLESLMSGLVGVVGGMLLGKLLGGTIFD